MGVVVQASAIDGTVLRVCVGGGGGGGGGGGVVGVAGLVPGGVSWVTAGRSTRAPAAEGDRVRWGTPWDVGDGEGGPGSAKTGGSGSRTEGLKHGSAVGSASLWLCGTAVMSAPLLWRRHEASCVGGHGDAGVCACVPWCGRWANAWWCCRMVGRDAVLTVGGGRGCRQRWWRQRSCVVAPLSQQLRQRGSGGGGHGCGLMMLLQWLSGGGGGGGGGGRS